MRNPHVFLAHAAESATLVCAVVYLSSERDAYGWFIGRRQDGRYASAYFLLQDIFAAAQARYEAVADEDLHSPWALDEPRRHELARLQELFAHGWLSLGEGEVRVRAEQLDKFSGAQPPPTYYSANFERPVLKELARHWPLEYRLHMEETAAAQKRRHAGHERP